MCAGSPRNYSTSLWLQDSGLLRAGSTKQLCVCCPLLVSISPSRTFGQWDETFGVPADGVCRIQFAEHLNNSLMRYPPLVTPFGKFAFPPDEINFVSAHWQRGHAQTIAVVHWKWIAKNCCAVRRRYLALAIEGIWPKRKHRTFDAFFGKFIQFMSAQNDKRKFRSFPVKQQFNDTEYVVFESQIFNDVYEPQFGSGDVWYFRWEGENNSLHLHANKPTGRCINLTCPGAYRYTASIPKQQPRNWSRPVLCFTASNRKSKPDCRFSIVTNSGKQHGRKVFKAENIGPWRTIYRHKRLRLLFIPMNPFIH